MKKESIFVSPEELARQEAFAQRLLRRNSADTAETGRVRRALVDCYGCQQNEADAEVLRGMLSRMGYAPAQSPEEADVVLVNTCAVREHAETRVLGNIGAFAPEKRRRPDMVVGVCGCMPQQPRMAEKLKKSYPFVDLVFGTHALWRLPELLWQAVAENRRVFDTEDSPGRIAEDLPVRRGDGGRAWVSVMYGCDNFCSYCIVPYVRGRERSRKPDKIVAEVEKLAAEGCRDITLLGQNVNSYGKDHGELDFPGLLRRLDAIEGEFVLRFMTSHPKDATHDLIDAMADSVHVARQLHLPVQSGSDRVLQAMNRHYTAGSYRALVAYARERMPELVLTSDVIVGFPGETEEDFLETLALVEELRFDALFTFLYSRREGTPAAALPDDTPREVRQERFDRLVALQNRISAEIHRGYVGRTLRLLLDGEGRAEGCALSARTNGGRLVHVKADPALRGRWADVLIQRGSTYALYGEAAPAKGTTTWQTRT